MRMKNRHEQDGDRERGWERRVPGEEDEEQPACTSGLVPVSGMD